ncbi:lytic polysaccharide monooxygenase [Streptomyces sp. ME19-01-6]|uniref:lytic polysaccharide monooxygenase auxiliary activity family 9 protein n=1 Tax=Streptomyces sp. ME19-01-6 TaxID=3028686 RepID=UPI0029BB25EF|nr:lytic polysaccharide monooxygenase [Streptomyces sp. ME19-01-6]MDX3227830.1 lytic polysaccharide monooxygenase [Streptomyces sp. ME19-01-6]
MTAHRTTTVAALLGAAPVLLTALAAGPAQAHGAPTDPVSRTVACSPEGGGNARSAACKAAVAAGGVPDEWDNLRVAQVAGRDRQRIPDGKLCSGGLDAYKGLDLARADWPATRLAAGADLTLTYRSTIPHTGTFQLYLTKEGYDPTRPLKWSDLEAKPFATATDPALTDDAYHIKAKLPSDRTGRQLLFTIWRNTSTPDTYYSCSDVVFTGADGAGGSDDSAPSTRGGGDADGTESAPSADNTGSTARTGNAGSAAESTDDTSPALYAGGAAVLALGAGVAVTLRRRRPR